MKVKNYKTDSLNSYLPYYIEHENVVMLDCGTLFSIFKLEGYDSITKTKEEIGEFNNQFINLINNVEDNYSVQIIYASNEHSKINFIKKDQSNYKIANTLAKSYSNELHKSTILRDINLYLVVIKKAAKEKKISDYLKSFYQANHNKNINEYRSDIQNFQLYLNKFENQLSSSLGFHIELLDEGEVLKLLSSFLNSSNRINEDILKKNYSYPMTIRERVCQTSIKEEKRFLNLGDKYCKVFRLKIPPQYTYAGISEEFLNEITCPFYISFHVDVLDSHKINLSLERVQSRKHALFVKSENAQSDNVISKDEIEEALMDQKTNGHHWFHISAQIVIYAQSIEELEINSDIIQKASQNKLGCYFEAQNYFQLHDYIRALPGCSIHTDYGFLSTSQNVADLIPISTPPKGTQDCDIKLINSARNSLFSFSPFSDEFNSWNSVVIGKIGSGKSFLVNSLLNWSLMSMEKPQVMILDLGKSFKRTCEIWGGDYLSIDLDNPNVGFNPLPTKEMLYNENNVNHSVLNFTIQFILYLTKQEDNPLSSRIVRKALEYLYIDENKTDPILEDVHNVLSQYEGVSSDNSDIELAKVTAKLLEEFVFGSYSKLFNQKTSFRFNSNFFCVDFRNAGQNQFLREVMTYALGSVIYRKMTENTDFKHIIFDEFATSMKHKTGAALCSMIAKTCRKHGAAFTCISQEIQDFQDNPASKAVFQQANFKWYLKLDDQIDAYKQSLHLNDYEVQLIKQLKTVKGDYSSSLLKYGDKSAVLKFTPDPVLYWICTTHAPDLTLEYYYRKKYKDLDNTEIIEILSSKFPNGVSQYDLKTDPVVKEGKCELQ